MAAPQSTPLPMTPNWSQLGPAATPHANVFLAALEPFRQDIQAQSDFINGIYAHQANIGTAGSIADDIETVVPLIPDAGLAAANIQDVGTVSGSIASVETVSAINGDVAVVADNAAGISAAATAAANTSAIAGVSNDVSSVAAIADQVSVLSPHGADIATVSANAGAISGYANVARAIARYTISVNRFKPLPLETLRRDSALGILAKGDAAGGLITDARLSTAIQILLGGEFNNSEFSVVALLDWSGSGLQYAWSLNEGGDPETTRLALRVDSSRRVDLEFWDGLTFAAVQFGSTLRIEPGKSVVGVSFSGDGITLSVGGQSVTADDPGLYANSTLLSIGRRPGSWYSWVGAAPSISLTARALSAETLNQLTA